MLCINYSYFINIVKSPLCYSPVFWHYRRHPVGKAYCVRISRIKIKVDNQWSWERVYGGNANLKECVLSLERNIGREDEFRVSCRREWIRESWNNDSESPSAKCIQCSICMELRGYPSLVYLNPPSFHWPSGWFIQKSSKINCYPPLVLPQIEYWVHTSTSQISLLASRPSLVHTACSMYFNLQPTITASLQTEQNMMIEEMTTNPSIDDAALNSSWLTTKTEEDLNHTDDLGRTPLWKAVSEDGHVDEVRFMVEAGCDVNLADIYGTTPLLVYSYFQFLLIQHSSRRLHCQNVSAFGRVEEGVAGGNTFVYAYY